MRIKLFAAGAAIALAATIGSASAAVQFSTLEGIAAQTMTQQEMGKVVGGHTVADGHVVDGVFGTDPLALKGTDPFVLVGAGGIEGILNGYVAHSPTCSEHPAGLPN